MTLNDEKWKVLFERHRILDKIEKEGQFVINAKAIKVEREPRLMTKFDHSVNLPSVFRENRLSILPITRGDYVIADMDVYREIEEIKSPIISVDLPSNIESIDFNNITSESTAINAAFVSGILSDFCDEEKLSPTVNGRMGSDSFQFDIQRIQHADSLFHVGVSNSQIEIDGGFEGSNSLTLLEAKNSLSTDFLVRQLYYPFRLWEGKVSKKVKPVFLIYSNNIFYLYEYAFEDINCYNSLVLKNSKRYSLEQKDIELSDIVQLLDSVKLVLEPQVPFPQADSFERVINLCELLYDENMTKNKVTETYEFTGRQASYYIDAGRYLGFVGLSKGMEGREACLTEKGRLVMRMSYREKQLAFVKAILEHRVFSESLRLYLKNAKLPQKSEIVPIMKTCQLYNVDSEKTYYRRASSILGWIDWALKLQS